MPPETLKEHWSEAEFRTYAVYRQHEPSVGQRLDFWFSHVAALLMNAFRKKNAKAVSGGDLVPDWWEERKKGPRSVEDWKFLLKGMATALGGKVK